MCRCADGLNDVQICEYGDVQMIEIKKNNKEG